MSNMAARRVRLIHREVLTPFDEGVALTLDGLVASSQSIADQLGIGLMRAPHHWHAMKPSRPSRRNARIEAAAPELLDMLDKAITHGHTEAWLVRRRELVALLKGSK